MNLLLDTHAFIWFLSGDSQLPASTKALIEDGFNRCYLSVASLWEIAIKTALNKLQLKGNFDDIEEFMVENDITLLPIEFVHLQKLLQLPPNHHDPFDRIIISQAQAQGLSIAIKDDVFKTYAVNLVWR